MVKYFSYKGSSNASNVNDCYTFHDVVGTWNEARDTCRDMGAHLVTMETNEEWNKVKGFIEEKVKESGSYTHWYIGLRKEGDMWKWTEAGSPGVTVATDDRRWHPREPSTDRDPRETCGEISSFPKAETPGHFNDIECNGPYGLGGTTPRGYICENY